MATYISPGVYVKEQDLSTYIPSLATTLVGMVGLGERGPINTPVYITSEQQFINTFGNPLTINGYGSPQHAALDYLRLGRSLWYVRTDNGANGGTSTASESTATLRLESPSLFTPDGSNLDSFTLTVYDGTNRYETAVTGIVSGELDGSDITLELDVTDPLNPVRVYTYGTETGVVSGTELQFTNVTFQITETVTADTTTASLTDSHTPVYIADALEIIATSKEKGTYLDGYRFGFSYNGYTDKVTFFVEKDDTIVETVGNLTFTDVVDMVDNINRESKLVNITINGTMEDGKTDKNLFEEFSTVPAYRARPTYSTLVSNDFSGGDNGTSGLTAGDVVGTVDDITGFVSGLEHFSNAEKMDINILCAPGFDPWLTDGNGDVVRHALVSIAEERADVISIFETPHDKVAAQSAYEWSVSSNFNSSYAAMYFSWLKYYDVTSESRITVSPIGAVLYAYTYTDYNAETWFAPAGLNRARIPFAEDVVYSASLGERDLLYTGECAINPIVNMGGDGIVIWGQRTTQSKPSALDRVNVRRLMIYIEKAIAKMSRYMLFEANTPKLWRDFENTVSPYLRYIQTREGLYNFRVICDETTNTPDVIDRNELNAIIQVEPVKAAEKFELTFQIMNTGEIGVAENVI